MKKSKKIKLIIGLFYILAVSLFLYFFFSKFTFQEIIFLNLDNLIYYYYLFHLSYLQLYGF